MLSKRGAHVLFVAVFSGALAAVVSLAMTILHTGVDAGLVSRWLRGGLLSWLIAFPSALLLVAPIQRLAEVFTRSGR